MIYTLLGKSAVDKIQSPLDRLVQSEKIRKLCNMYIFDYIRKSKAQFKTKMLHEVAYIY